MSSIACTGPRMSSFSLVLWPVNIMLCFRKDTFVKIKCVLNYGFRRPSWCSGCSYEKQINQNGRLYVSYWTDSGFTLKIIWKKRKDEDFRARQQQHHVGASAFVSVPAYLITAYPCDCKVWLLATYGLTGATPLHVLKFHCRCFQFTSVLLWHYYRN